METRLWVSSWVLSNLPKIYGATTSLLVFKTHQVPLQESRSSSSTSPMSSLAGAGALIILHLKAYFTLFLTEKSCRWEMGSSPAHWTTTCLALAPIGRGDPLGLVQAEWAQRQRSNSMVRTLNQISISTLQSYWALSAEGELDWDHVHHCTDIVNLLSNTGTSLSLYGSLSGQNSNTAVYQVDDQEPEMFQLLAPIIIDPDSNMSIGTQFNLTNQLFFNASGLSVGEHVVTVALSGNAMDMPLSIDYFYITSLTAVEQASLTSPSLLPTTTHSPAITRHSHSRVVIGAVVGSVFVLIVGAILVTIWWNRSKKMKGYPTFIDPFSFPATHFLRIPPSKLQIMGVGMLHLFLVRQGNHY